MKTAVSLASLIFVSLVSSAFADTIYLKNGRSIEGVIVKEDDLAVDLEVGFGTVKFEKKQIEKIHKSDPEELAQIERGWQKQKARTDAIKGFAEEERNKSITQWKEKQKTFAGPENAKNEGASSQDITLAKETGHLMVEAVINDKAHATLLVDTGSSLVVLTKKVARELALDADSSGGNIELEVAGGKKLNAKQVNLKSLAVGDAVVRNVPAAVLDEDGENALFKDGLLGMSYLRNFNFTFDYENNKLILESHKQK